MYRIYLIIILFLLLCIMIVYTQKQRECFIDINIVSDNLPTSYNKEKGNTEVIIDPITDNYFRDNIVGYYEGYNFDPKIKSTYEQCIETANNYNKTVTSENDKYVAISYRNNEYPEPLKNTCLYYKKFFNANTLINDGDNALRYNTLCVEQDKNISDGCV